jgi:hypothetical protein
MLEGELVTHHESRKGSPYYAVTPYPMKVGRTANPVQTTAYFGVKKGFPEYGEKPLVQLERFTEGRSPEMNKVPGNSY